MFDFISVFISPLNETSKLVAPLPVILPKYYRDGLKHKTINQSLWKMYVFLGLFFSRLSYFPLLSDFQNVEGEVYSVSEKLLKNLDELERHPTFYTRQEIPVQLNGRTQVMWCYLLQNFRQDFLQRPALRTYDSKDYPEFLGGSHKPPTEEERQKFIAYAKGTA